MFGNILLIINPTARSGKARRTRHDVCQFFKDITDMNRGHFYEMIETSHPLDAVIIAHELGPHFDTVFVLGGDGIVHEVVNGLMQIPEEDRPCLGVLPAGQGNDFARSLGLPLDPMKVFKEAANLKVKTIDIGKVNDRYFAETLSFGVDAAIALETMERRKKTKRTGTILYIESGFNQIKNHLNAIDATVQLDNRDPQKLSFYTFAVQNGTTYGGGFNITPQAQLDDGQFDICYAAPPLSRFEAVRVFIKAKSGKHVNNSHIHFETAKELVISFDHAVPAQLDGEPIEALDYHVTLLPHALKVLSL
ncbi:diacylglycerol/lipid kinase family protein [Anaerotardibacter muris]|uniref:diacylglycerol/lipid kinase family protein n=1 Tax=Anaerotardibacter muris TaxID=2941505 RepID=UPI0020420592|nr:diacylglycerol kinase family protein [Anaerotardibacter muris]